MPHKEIHIFLAQYIPTCGIKLRMRAMKRKCCQKGNLGIRWYVVGRRLKKEPESEMRGERYGTEIIFKRLYVSCHWAGDIIVRQCRNPVCVAVILIKPDRFIGVLRDCDSVCFYSCNPTVASWGDCCGQGE